MGQQEILELMSKLKTNKKITTKEINKKLGTTNAAAVLKKLRAQNEINFEKIEYREYIYWKRKR